MLTLQNMLKLDALIGVLSALLLLSANRLMSDLTGLPADFLFFVGLLLVPLAAGMTWVALRAHQVTGAVWAIIVGNCLWAVASVVVMLGPWFFLTGFGWALLVAQTLMVLTFAVLEQRLLGGGN